jgi:phosphoribosylformimino-5-aminoimidazole carboxamide ribotide isomerase
MIELIPAIDIIEGKCVRLTQGDYDSKKVYNEDPLEVAKMFENYGIRRLHVVDLDGAREGRIIHHRVLERLATQTSLIIDFGGGMKTADDLKIAFNSGARMITGGSIAVKEPETFLSWVKQYGSQKIILGADGKNGKIAINGWQNTTEQELIPFIEYYRQQGIRKVICTDIGRDGMLQGPAIDLYRNIREVLPDIYLIASGGVGTINDIDALEAAGIPAVIFGKAIYEGRIQLKELSQFAHKTGETGEAGETGKENQLFSYSVIQ